jgi:hypothetical protein
VTTDEVLGWDINLWAFDGLGFYSESSEFLLSGPGTVARLNPNALVDFSSNYDPQGIPGNSGQWLLNSSDNFFGFRFYNEDTKATHYGWGRLSFGPDLDTRTLVEYAYESIPGLAITVIPEPSSLGMILVALASMGLVASRRRRA